MSGEKARSWQTDDFLLCCHHPRYRRNDSTGGTNLHNLPGYKPSAEWLGTVVKKKKKICLGNVSMLLFSFFFI